MFFHKAYPAFFLMLVMALALGIVPDAVAQPRDKCVQERTIAENRYLVGRFDEAVALLQQCLDREDLFVDEAVQVYRLISLIHLNRGDLGQAQQTIRDLLQKAPAYQADPVQDPPSYTTMVAIIRQEIEAQAHVQTPAPSEEAPEEQSQANQQEARPEPPPRSIEPALPPMVVHPSSTQRRRILRTPQSWLLATAGAVVIATAVALVLGGSSESSPAPPR